MASMEKFLDVAETVIVAIFNFALFVVMSALFLPAFLIVTYLQKPWEASMKDIFGL